MAVTQSVFLPLCMVGTTVMVQCIVVILVAMVMTVVPSGSKDIVPRTAANKSPCVDPLGNVCGNKGTCSYGVACQCEGYNIGRWCQDNMMGPSNCARTKDCVRCSAFETGPIPPAECVARCLNDRLIATIEVVDQLKYDGKRCQFYDEDNDCFFYYEYYDKEDFPIDLDIKVLRHKDC